MFMEFSLYHWILDIARIQKILLAYNTHYVWLAKPK